MKYHALFVIFAKAAKFEIAVLIGGALLVNYNNGSINNISCEKNHMKYHKHASKSSMQFMAKCFNICTCTPFSQNSLFSRDHDVIKRNVCQLALDKDINP